MKQVKLSILFILFAFIFVKTSFAQINRDSIPKHNTSYIAVSVGGTFPMGNFALADISNPSAGFAKPGFNAGISFTKILWRRMGIAAMYRYQNNAIDNADLLSQTSTRYPNIAWDASTNPWKVNAFMAGYYSSYPLDRAKKIFLDLKLMLGMVRATSPEFDLTGSQGSNIVSATQAASVSNAFGYCIGFGFKFDITTDVYLLIHADYLESTPKYSNVAITSSNGNATTQTFTQNISTINLSAGVAFKID